MRKLVLPTRGSLEDKMSSFDTIHRRWKWLLETDVVLGK